MTAENLFVFPFLKNSNSIKHIKAVVHTAAEIFFLASQFVLGLMTAGRAHQVEKEVGIVFILFAYDVSYFFVGCCFALGYCLHHLS